MQFHIAHNPFMMMPITFAREDGEDIHSLDAVLHHISTEEFAQHPPAANNFRAAEPV